MIGMVDAGFVGYQTGCVHITHQSHGLPRDSQTALAFRTNGNKFEELPQGLRDIAVVFVSAVKSNLFSQQTGTNANLD